MSIFNKKNNIDKKNSGDDPQQFDDQQRDYLDDPFLDEFDQFDDSDDWSYGSEGYEDYPEDDAESWYEPEETEYDESEEADYEPEQDVTDTGRKKKGFSIPDFSFLRSTDNMMIILCLILSVILLFFCGFLVVKTHTLSASNSKLEQRVQRDTKLKKSESEYESEAEELESETDTLINSYGAGNTPEKTIMFLSNLSSTSGLSVTSIEFGESENVTVDENGKRLKGAAKAPDPTKETSSSSSDKEKSSDDSKDKDSKDESSNQYYLYKYQVTFSYTGSYAQMKRAIQFIEDYGERTTVNDITSTYDETTQNLTGSITLNMYTLSGTAQEYTAPSVSGSLGNSDIFG